MEYQKGKINQSNYLSRHGKPFSTLPENEQMEADELHNFLYTLLTTPVTDQLGKSSIAKCTTEQLEIVAVDLFNSLPYQTIS